PSTNHDVDKLIMIGTPNAGLPWADYAHNLTSSFPGLQKLLDKFLPISYILTTSYMQNYDATHGFNPKVRYSTIPGWWHPGWLDFSLEHLRAIICGHGDTWVPKWSVQYLKFTSDFPVDSYGRDHCAKH